MIAERMTSDDVLAAHWDGSVPVRPVALAARLGVRVFKRSNMLESGYVYIDDDGQPRIVYNADEAEVRQRFTIAHELGHYALGHLSSGKTMWRDTKDSFSSAAYNPSEVEANRFAARLLMPADAIKVAVADGNRTIAGLADLFRVSQVAMKFRLKNLGMLRG